MSYVYPSNYELWILTETAGTNFITTQACEIIRNKYKSIIKRICISLLAITLNKDDKVIDTAVIINSIDDNLSYGDYISKDFLNSKYDDNDLIKVYQKNSTKLLTSESRFLGSLRSNMFEYGSLYFREKEDEISEIKITKNAANLLQRYLERKLTIYIRSILKRIEGNTIMSSHVDILNDDSCISKSIQINKTFNYNFFVDIAKVVKFEYPDVKLKYETVVEINTLINLLLSYTFDLHKKLSPLFKDNVNFDVPIKILYPEFENREGDNKYISSFDKDKLIRVFSLYNYDEYIKDNIDLLIKVICRLITDFIDIKVLNISNINILRDLFVKLNYMEIFSNIPYYVKKDPNNRLGEVPIKLSFPEIKRDEKIFVPSLFELTESEYPLEGFLIGDINFEKERLVELIYSSESESSEVFELLTEVISDELDIKNSFQKKSNTTSDIKGISNKSDKKDILPLIRDNPDIRYRDTLIKSDINPMLIERINNLTYVGIIEDQPIGISKIPRENSLPVNNGLHSEEQNKSKLGKPISIPKWLKEPQVESNKTIPLPEKLLPSEEQNKSKLGKEISIPKWLKEPQIESNKFPINEKPLSNYVFNPLKYIGKNNRK